MTPERLRQIEELYHSAREREPNERAAFLAQACLGDEELRQELDQLLAPDPSSGNILDRPAGDLLGGSTIAQLTTGTQIGPYKIEAELGAGGMGEVYRAVDTRLKRTVAIKVAKENFEERFEREARAIAALNHPNICTLHDVGPNYLVMELIEGPTLADRIKQGPIPLEEGLGIARQIADALEAAHEKGVVHRDLKPGNVKITPDGKVKVFDFGLARTIEVSSGSSTPSNSPTRLSMGTTNAGVILGTAAYMAPEQANGKAVDKRADIWAFGAVLYEILTGKQAFHGDDIMEVLAAVVKTEPDWNQLTAQTPPSIRTLVRRCLEKNLRRRLSHIAEARVTIEDVLSGAASAEAVAAPGVTALARRRTFLLAAGCSLALGLIAAIAVWNLKPAPLTPPKPVTRTVITLPPGDRLAAADEPVVAISPDGTQLAYVAIRGGTQQIFLRAMDGFEALAVAGTEGASEVFFSPDGQWLGFFASGKLKKISVKGGAAITLDDTGVPRGASWGSQGTIVFAPSNTSALQRVPDGGGAAQPLTHLEERENSHRWPQFLPGGKAVVFTSGSAGTNAPIVVQDIKSGERKNLVQGAMQPRYAPSGHLVYAQAGTLMAAPFDPDLLVVSGAAVPVVENVLQSSVTGATQYSISATGSLVYVTGGTQAGQRRLVLVSRAGKEQELPAAPHNYDTPKLSPDGSKIVVIIVEKEVQIWTYDLRRDSLTRLTFEGSFNGSPLWTPDGKRIAYVSNKEGSPKGFWQLADGSGGVEKLTGNPRAALSWSGDGQLLALSDVNPTTGYDIWVLNMTDRKEQPFLRTRSYESYAQFSPDGRWLAYVSDESGHYEVYVQPYPGPGGKWQISTDGGTEPHWSSNGRELVYWNAQKVMAVDVSTQPTFSKGKPRKLFEGQYLPPTAGTHTWDVSADGQRFLMLKPAGQEQAAPTQINVVLNWTEELKRLAPTGKK